jgi:hypothetical protein
MNNSDLKKMRRVYINENQNGLRVKGDDLVSVKLIFEMCLLL